MKNIIVACTLSLSALSSLAFAEEGGDRVHERNKIHVQEALAAQEKATGENRNTAESGVEANSKSS